MTTSLRDATELLLAEPADLHRFLALEELHGELDRLLAAHPRLVRSRVLGHSREGRDIRCYTVGNTGPEAVWYAGPHANEPVGGGTVLYLARRLCADAELRASVPWTIHLVPCIDPDAYELNRGWLSGPFTTGHYHRNMHRPPMQEWPDWDFPISQPPLVREPRMPETLALQRLLDDVRPRFLYSLHNAEVGGGFFYVSPDLTPAATDLCAVLQRAGLPPETALLEDPSLRPIAPGVFGCLDTQPHFDALIATGGPDPSRHLRHGDAATAYAQRRGSATLVAEVPYWSFKTRPTEHRSLREVIVQTSNDLSAFAVWLAAAASRLQEAQAGPSPLMRTLLGGPTFLEQQVAGMRQYAAVGPDLERQATPEESSTYRWMLGTAVPQRFRGALLRVLAEVSGLDDLQVDVQHDFAAADAALSAAVGQPHDPALLAEVQAVAGLVAQAHLLPA